MKKNIKTKERYNIDCISNYNYGWYHNLLLVE